MVILPERVLQASGCGHADLLGSGPVVRELPNQSGEARATNMVVRRTIRMKRASCSGLHDPPQRIAGIRTTRVRRFHMKTPREAAIKEPAAAMPIVWNASQRPVCLRINRKPKAESRGP